MLKVAASLLLIFTFGCVLTHGEPLSKAEELYGRAKALNVKNLPPHPRLILSDKSIARLRAASHSGPGLACWTIVIGWLDREYRVSSPPDPPPQKRFTSGALDIKEFRRIQNAAEDVESHILLPAAAYRLTGDTRYLDLARRWVAAVVRWNPKGATGVSADDYAARQTLYALAVAYDGLFAQWSAEEKRAIRECITARAIDVHQHLLPFKLDAYNNHPWFQCSALVDAGLALADESPEADRWWRDGAELYFTRFLPLWGQDGDWHEGINYFTFTMKYICHFADAMEQAAGIFPFEIPSLQKAGYFRLYAAPPDSIGIYFNDTRPLAVQQWDRATAYRLAAEAKDPVLQWYADQLPGKSKPVSLFYALLYRDPALPSSPPSNPPPARYFRDSGWVIARTSLTAGTDVEFGFKSSPWAGTEARPKGHDHPDANNFLLNFLGKPLLVDSGFYDYYSSPHHKSWTSTGRAHNTLLIDGQEQLTRQPGKVLSFQTHAGQFDWMEGEGAGAYPPGLLKSWRRQVLFLRPDVFVIRDVVRTLKPSTVTWLLHGPSPFEMDGQSFVCRNSPAAVAGTLATPLHLSIRQWSGFPPNAQPERSKPSDYNEYPEQAHLEFTTPQKIGETTSVLVFCPSRGDQLKHLTATVAARDGNDSVTVRASDGRSWTIEYRSDSMRQ